MGVRRRDEREEELDQGPELDEIEETPDAEFTEGISEATIKITSFLQKVRSSSEVQGAVILDLTRKGERAQRNMFRMRYHLDDAARMAKEVLDTVEDKIQTVYGRVVITLRVVDHPDFSMQFTLRRPQPEAANGQLGDNIYAPDEIAVALMDHSQVQMKMLLQKAQADDAGLRIDLDRARKRIAELEAHITHYLALIGKLTRMEWLVESEREDKKMRRERSEQLFKMGVPLAMAMFAKLTGGDPNMAPMLGMLAGGAVSPAGPPPPPGFGPPPGMGPPSSGNYPAPPQANASPSFAGPTPLEKCVSDLFSSLTQDQFVKIASSPDMFKPDQVMMLMQIGDLLSKQKEEWSKAETQAPPPHEQASAPASPPKSQVHDGDFDDDAPWTGGFTFTPRPT